MVKTIYVEIPPAPSNDMCGSYDYVYVDYEQRGEYAGWGGDAGYHSFPINSLKSLLDVNECISDNPDETFLILKINEKS